MKFNFQHDSYVLTGVNVGFGSITSDVWPSSSDPAQRKMKALFLAGSIGKGSVEDEPCFLRQRASHHPSEIPKAGTCLGPCIGARAPSFDICGVTSESLNLD